ncbi:Gfo/Idh/MocA family oxidoreductase [Actinokineospora soli]|uniref:Gfo/Idh/MocA family oxidoreductase n=1 Tax=Actinokineospora soli TaxID=1048753 RepID=A0ABW2TQF5_9PSEU
MFSVGLIGYGLAGSAFHAPYIDAVPDLRLSAVVTSGHAAAVGARYPDVAVVSTVDELLARDLDLVVVASPNRFHVEHAGAALDAGAAVVVDKPAAGTADEVRALTGGRLTVFQNRRWDGDFATVRRLVAEGCWARSAGSSRASSGPRAPAAPRGRPAPTPPT